MGYHRNYVASDFVSKKYISFLIPLSVLEVLGFPENLNILSPPKSWSEAFGKTTRLFFSRRDLL